MAGMTLPQCLMKQAQEHPHSIAMREKQKGIWQEWTWAQYLEEVRALTLGLVALGDLLAQGWTKAPHGSEHPGAHMNVPA